MSSGYRQEVPGMIFRVAHTVCACLFAHFPVCVRICSFTNECVSDVLILAASARSCVCVCLTEREPFGNNSSVSLGIPCFPPLGTGCPSCNTITVTTVAITVTTEPQVNKGGGGGSRVQSRKKGR